MATGTNERGRESDEPSPSTPPAAKKFAADKSSSPKQTTQDYIAQLAALRMDDDDEGADSAEVKTTAAGGESGTAHDASLASPITKEVDMHRKETVAKFIPILKKHIDPMRRGYEQRISQLENQAAEKDREKDREINALKNEIEALKNKVKKQAKSIALYQDGHQRGLVLEDAFKTLAKPEYDEFMKSNKM